MEHDYRLEIVIAITAEASAILSLGVFLAIADRRATELRKRIPPRDQSGSPRATPTATEAQL